MTAVNVTETKNTVTVSGEGAATVVTVTTAGPQGASGLGTTVDASAKVDKSVVYYDSASGKFKADDTWTTSTLVLGGNF